MPQLAQYGSLNTAALIVPDLYVQIVPPRNLVINGVPSNRLGIVGSATWGPVGQPAIIGTMTSYAASFGLPVARKYDMGTHVATSTQNGATDFRCVRVTDGTDTAATVSLFTGGTVALTLAARYTGSLGNSIRFTLGAGTKAGTVKLVVLPPVGLPEVFDNIPATPGQGAAAWAAIVAAVNTGSGVLRGPSQWVVATQSTSTADPSTATGYGGGVLGPSGGTDGATGVTSALVVGQDGATRTGMYALRGQGCALGLLADVDDSTQWTTEAAFGLSEGVYMIATGPSGDTIANAGTTKQNAGLDSYAVKLMFGDWIYWNDPYNQVLRLVSPQGFAAGRLASLSPEQSSLNKQMYSVVGSQKSGLPGSAQAAAYSSADLIALGQAGIDVICNPQPGGSYWGARFGHNSSSSASIDGDNYTRLTNFIACTVLAGMGVYVGRVVNAALLKAIRATLLSFLQGLLSQGILGSTDGSLPFSVVCDTTNNDPNRVALGYVQADTQVRYQAINEKFIVNLEGGQTVQVVQPSTGATLALAA